MVLGSVLVERSVTARVVDDRMWCGFRCRYRVEYRDGEVICVSIEWQDFVHLSTGYMRGTGEGEIGCKYINRMFSSKVMEVVQVQNLREQLQ